MTSYRNKYLEMLKTDFGKKPIPDEPPKLTKPCSVSFVSSQDRPVSDFSPPLDAEGVPCGLCPTCRRGEFWRWPKFHKDHNPTGWGFAGSAPRLHPAVVLATSAVCLTKACTHKPTQMLTWMRRPTSVIGGKADMARACHYVR